MVALTKVKSKGRQGKETLVEHVRENLDDFKNAYVVSFENIRAGPFKALAAKMRKDSRFFLGRNKVIQLALGRTPEEEHADNSHLLAKYMRGQVSLLFTNKTTESLEKYFGDEEVPDFATAGVEATYTVFLEKGTAALEGYSHALEPYLKELGLPTRLNFQKIELLSDVYVCREGQKLNVEQAKLLKLLGHKMAAFKLKLLCQRSNSKDGKFREFEAGKHFLAKYGNVEDDDE